MNQKILSSDEYFYLSSGVALKSISDLVSFLNSADASSFEHHVNSSKNDFYNWVLHALENSKLAESIKQCDSASSMASAIESFSNPKSSSSDKLTEMNVSDEGNFSSFTDLNSRLESVKSSLSLKSDSESEISSDSKDVKEINIDSLNTKPKKEKSKVVSVLKESLKLTKIKKSSNASKPKKMNAESKVSIPKKKSVSKKPYSVKSKTFAKLSEPSIEPISSPARKDKFDYSFSFDDEKDTLSKIKERISLMDKELKLSSSSGVLDSISKSLNSVEEGYPSLEHGEIPHKELKPKGKSVMHHIRHASKKAHGHMKSATSKVVNKVKTVHRDMRDKAIDAKKQDDIKAYLKKAKLDDSLTTEKYSDVGFDVVDETRPSLKLPEDSDLKSVPVKSKPVGKFFRTMFSKFKKSEKVVEKALPNLHEFAHERRAEERMNPYEDLENKKNYHIHGFPDFVRGLLIGLVIGMLFIVLF